ncbi:choice-of-anchor G family protein [Microbacterium sp. NPDC055903]
MAERARMLRRFSAVAMLASAALIVQASVISNASWNDAEWTSAPLSAVDCAAPDDAFATRGEGRALSGALLGIDLDSLAEASGVEVTNDGSRAVHTPAGANPATGPDAWANPLNVTALSAVNVNLGGGILQLPLNNSTGVLGQYGQAQDTGVSAGAGGYVTDTGGIGLEPGNGYPELAELKLSQLLAQINPAVAGALSGVTDVSLEVGAVAGRAMLDGCETAWSGASALASSLSREYLVASADTVITSPTVGGLVTGLSGIITSLQATVDTLETTLRTTIRDGIAGLLSGVLGTLSLGSVTIDSFILTIDTSAVAALLTTTIADDAGIVSIDLGDGTITVDTAALLGAAYGESGRSDLNGLDPNTDLLSNPAVLTALTDALTSALDDWVMDVDAALQAAIDGIRVQLGATVVLRLAVVNVATIAIGLDAPLGTLDTAVVDVDASLLGGLISLDLLDPLVEALVSGVGGLVGGIIEGALPTVASLVQALDAPVAAVLNVVSLVYSTLYLSGVVSLVVNAQNDPLTGAAEPADWAALPDGRYDVAALRIGVLGALAASDVRLYLGRGSVGAVCSLAQAPVDCAGY